MLCSQKYKQNSVIVVFNRETCQTVSRKIAQSYFYLARYPACWIHCVVITAVAVVLWQRIMPRSTLTRTLSRTPSRTGTGTAAAPVAATPPDLQLLQTLQQMKRDGHAAIQQQSEAHHRALEAHVRTHHGSTALYDRVCEEMKSMESEPLRVLERLEKEIGRLKAHDCSYVAACRWLYAARYLQKHGYWQGTSAANSSNRHTMERLWVRRVGAAEPCLGS